MLSIGMSISAEFQLGGRADGEGLLLALAGCGSRARISSADWAE